MSEMNKGYENPEDARSRGPESKVLAVQIEFLMKEYDAINKTIERIDTFIASMKNWTVVVWGGMLSVLIAQKQTEYLWLAAIIPACFYVVDTWWRHLQWRFVFRISKIEAFLNGDGLQTAVREGKMIGFGVLDPKAHSERNSIEYKRTVNWSKAMYTHKVYWFYAALVAVALLLQMSSAVHAPLRQNLGVLLALSGLVLLAVGGFALRCVRHRHEKVERR